MRLLQVLVQAIPLIDQLLLPGPESLLLDLDLLSEAFPQSLFLLLELGVVQLSWSSFAKLASLHLLATICLVVVFFSSVDQVQHVITDEHGSELAEITVFLVLDLGDTPRILATLDSTAVCGGDVLLGSYHREWHGVDELVCIWQDGIIFVIERWLVNLDALCLDDCPYLQQKLAVIGRCRVVWTHSMLEARQVSRAESVGLGNDRNQIDSGRKTLHDLNVKGLQAVAGWADEVETSVDTEVDSVDTTWLLLLKHVRLVLVVQKLNDWLP